MTHETVRDDRADETPGDLPGRFRPAIIKDAREVQRLIKFHADKGEMLPRSLNELFETIRQYTLYEENDKILGCCGLHIAWEDLAEVRALAVDPSHMGRGIGAALVRRELTEAARLGIPRVFTLTYVPGFFEKLGFELVDKNAFPHKIWSECVKCHKFPDCDETGMIIATPGMGALR
jgi:amino-acid N-acetyltransferase